MILQLSVKRKSLGVTYMFFCAHKKNAYEKWVVISFPCIQGVDQLAECIRKIKDDPTVGGSQTVLVGHSLGLGN